MGWPFRGRTRKYGNKKTFDPASGLTFASKLERDVHQYLKLLQAAGEVRDIRTQVKVYLTDARILYIADFLVFDVPLGKDVYYEAKGFEKPEWKLKRRLWQFYGPGILRVVKAGLKIETITAR